MPEEGRMHACKGSMTLDRIRNEHYCEGINAMRIMHAQLL